ncbi:NosD domain-containing protein [Psychromarinibacter sp. S121]|uniref:NosD domain-containing protein n=1 Tax=Psychromarinibacter sp. S121 TaxID=3415127 RepID=UPI003C7CDB0F
MADLRRTGRLGRLTAPLLGAALATMACATAQAQAVDRYAELRRGIVGAYATLSGAAHTAEGLSALPDLGHADGMQILPPPVDVRYDTLTLLPDAHISLIDVRVTLLQMSQSAGANGQLMVLRAQHGDTPKAIAVQDGTISLADLMRTPEVMDASGPDGLTLPLVIWPGARLIVGKGETLKLSRSDGAFLANFGALVVNGGAIEGAGGEHAEVPEFAPFVITAGTGHMVIRNARLEHLGFDVSPAFAGLTQFTGGLYPAEDRTLVTGSVLRDVLSVTLKGATAPVVTGNLFHGMHGEAVELRATQDAVIAGNLFIDGAQGNAIRVTDASTGTEIADNRIFRAGGGAIRVDDASHETRIFGNIVWGSDGVGITVEASDCAVLAGNVALENRMKGISLRAVRAGVVRDNRILANGSAGLFVADQPGEVPTLVDANLFVGNRAGLDSASGGKLALRGNDLTDQFPRFFDGDLNGLTPEIVGNLRGETDMLLSVGHAPRDGLAPLSCSPEQES